MAMLILEASIWEKLAHGSGQKLTIRGLTRCAMRMKLLPICNSLSAYYMWIHLRSSSFGIILNFEAPVLMSDDSAGWAFHPRGSRMKHEPPCHSSHQAQWLHLMYSLCLTLSTLCQDEAYFAKVYFVAPVSARSSMHLVRGAARPRSFLRIEPAAQHILALGQLTSTVGLPICRDSGARCATKFPSFKVAIR